MPGWCSQLVSWLQLFAEEEGLLLGLSLTGYAVDLWLRLLQASRSLDRVQCAPSLDIASLRALADALESSETSPSGTTALLASDPSSQGSREASGATSSMKPPGEMNASGEAVRSIPGNADALVIVRGRVQPTWDPQPWQLFTGPGMIQAENAKVKGVVHERIEKVVCFHVHQFLHNVSEHPVNARRSQIPFELSEIPVPASLSSPPAPQPSAGPSLPTPHLPFASSPPSPARVRVSLEGLTQPLPLVTVHSAFHRSTPSLTSLLLHFVTGSQPIGQKVEERVLMAGTDLTAVGLMRRDKDGHLYITPSRGLPVFLTPLSKEQLMMHLSGTCSALFHTSVFFSVAAVAALGYVGFRRWDHRRRQERARRLVEALATLEQASSRRRAEAEAQRSAGSTGEGASGTAGAAAPGPSAAGEARAGDEPEEDLSNIGNGELCVVCLGRRRRAVFVPCGHLVCCWACAQAVRSRAEAQEQGNSQCPVCRAPFTGVIRVFSS